MRKHIDSHLHVLGESQYVDNPLPAARHKGGRRTAYFALRNAMKASAPTPT